MFDAINKTSKQISLYAHSQMVWLMNLKCVFVKESGDVIGIFKKQYFISSFMQISVPAVCIMMFRRYRVPVVL